MPLPALRLSAIVPADQTGQLVFPALLEPTSTALAPQSGGVDLGAVAQDADMIHQIASLLAECDVGHL